MRYPIIDNPLGLKKKSSLGDKAPLDKNVFVNNGYPVVDEESEQKEQLPRSILAKIFLIQWKVTNWLTSTPCFVYCSHFLSAWGDRMWTFAVGLFLIQLSPDSLQLTAIYGLSLGGAILLFAPLIGDWVDKNPRLKAARLTLFLQNMSVIVCAVLICLLVKYLDWAVTIWNGWLVVLWQAGIIIVAVFAGLASLGNKISVQRDWIVEICGRDKDKLATMGAVLRRIDLATKLLAPVATGQVLTFASMFIGAIFIASWNFVSWFIEYALLWKVYKAVPALAIKKSKKDVLKEILESPEGENEKAEKVEGDENQDVEVPLTVYKTNENTPESENPEATHKEVTDKQDNSSKTSPANQNKGVDEPGSKRAACCRKGGMGYKMCGAFIILFKGWRTYMRNSVATAGIGLGCLYLTVLGFDNITSAYAYSQGLSESILGILMGSGAVIGIAGTFAFTRIRRRVGLERTGLFSFSAQISCLTLCVFSIWLPGSPFDPFSEHVPVKVNVSACNASALQPPSSLPIIDTSTISLDNSTVADQSYSTAYAPGRPDVSRVPICPDPPRHSFISIGVLMAGIITARFGLWITDLTVTQLMLENVHETERGVVNGVQSALNQLMDMLKFALVVGVPHPPQFGILIIISFLAVSTGGVFYASYSRKIRGHLFHPEKLKCYGHQGTPNRTVEIRVDHDGDRAPSSTPALAVQA